MVAVAGGGNQSLALKSDGTIVQWGGSLFVPNNLTTPLHATANGVNANVTGNYQVIYSITNSLGDVGSLSRSVVVEDTLPPVITLLGSNIMIITNLSSTLVDPGATVFDACSQGSYPITTNSTVNLNRSGLYTITYSATDSSGNTGMAQRSVAVILPTSGIPGDTDNDGVVSRAELDAVYANYVTNSPWLMITNMAGLGGTNVEFSLSNSILGAYTAEYSTNLTTWQPLGPATPRYLFTDTNALSQPQRYYRLRYP
ncbi:MAG TPA: immunoglobulin-like domain-containing protein [Verrucomicrobiae bacterium]|nr:immunoglobulin-like domain-containing protein [Verrucomicrobiae bacterium]